MDLSPNSTPIGINLGDGGSTVTNLGPGTVSYANRNTTVADGTIASSASATLYGLQYFFVTTTRASLKVVPLDSTIRLGNITLFVGTNDPGSFSAEGDIWIDTN